MRPANVTDEDIREWEEDRQDHLKEESRNGGFASFIPVPPDVWYAGCWLGRELEAAGCPDELRSDITAACGQRQAYSNDPWQTAVDTLENYKKGVWESPGPDLALQLIHEKYGNPPDAQRMLADMIKAGADPEKLLALAAERDMDRIIQRKRKPTE
jgi:hypothetical protein